MAREEIRFTREEFYEKLWMQPTTKVAKELGCSDVLIGKICKVFRIPKPYLGYWAKVQHGKHPKKTLLPKCDDPDLQSLGFYKYPDKETTVEKPEPEPGFDPDVQELLEKARSLPPVQVPLSLNHPHPLVKTTRDRLLTMRRAAKDGAYCGIPLTDAPGVDVSLSSATTTRGLCIMDALVKRVEEIGGKVEVQGDRWRKETVVVFAGEKVASVRLREKNRQLRVPQDKNQLWQPTVRLEPTGLLILDGGPSCFNTCYLQDTPKLRRIEDGLNDLIIGFVVMAGRQRIYRREAEEARKRREEEERIRRQAEEELRRKREELQQRQKAEQARVDELVKHANSWRQSQIIRDCLDAARRMLVARDGAVPTEGEAAEYLAWAERQADRLDPLAKSPPSILDERL